MGFLCREASGLSGGWWVSGYFSALGRPARQHPYRRVGRTDTGAPAGPARVRGRPPGWLPGSDRAAACVAP
ncbi:hypothetical protein GCM10025795_52360 [Verticiella sediminum]